MMSQADEGRPETLGGLTREDLETDGPWQAFLEGEAATFRWPNSPHSTRPPHGLWVLPGAFNPLHEGHLAMAQWVRQRYGVAVHFELSMVNVDKGRIAPEAIHARMNQFTPLGEPLQGAKSRAGTKSESARRGIPGTGGVVWVTRAPTFDEKADLFPAATFVVGADTMVRIADPSYYAGGVAGLHAAVDRFEQREIRFLVFGRQVGGQFLGSLPKDLPPSLQQRCEMVVETEFRMDISSSELRAQRRRR